MKSTEAVDQVKAIAEGFRALVSLQHGSDAQAMKLIGGLKVAGEGTKLNIRWSASADDVWPRSRRRPRSGPSTRVRGTVAQCAVPPPRENVRFMATRTRASLSRSMRKMSSSDSDATRL